MTWAAWERLLSNSATLRQRRLALTSDDAVRPAFLLVIYNEMEISPRVESFASFEEMTEAFLELPDTCYAVPCYGAVLSIYKTPEGRRFIKHPTGAVEPLNLDPPQLLEDFYVGEGPADLLEADEAVRRALPQLAAAGGNVDAGVTFDEEPLLIDEEASSVSPSEDELIEEEDDEESDDEESDDEESDDEESDDEESDDEESDDEDAARAAATTAVRRRPPSTLRTPREDAD